MEDDERYGRIGGGTGRWATGERRERGGKDGNEEDKDKAEQDQVGEGRGIG